MRNERKRTTFASVRALLTALVLVLGMIAVASVTVVLSTSQQLSTPQIGVTSSASTSIVNETSHPPVNQTTTGQQGRSSLSQMVFVSILLGSADAVEISYSPDQVTVVIGVNNTVTWVNNDNAAHTVTASDGSFGSGSIAPGGSYTYTFTTPGTYRYYCAYHSWMVGVVVAIAG